jgi:arylamine N-acetyltransferase
MPTLTGRKTFADRRHKIRSDGTVKELHVNSEEEFRRLLREHFGLTINDRLRFLVVGGE